MSQKRGFWSVFALVTNSQIGTGALMLPATLAPFGVFSLGGWAISSCGAITLALLFAVLCARFPKTGGPHVYVYKAFGPSVAFFIGWTYWVISWVSTSAVVVASVAYLSPLIGYHGSLVCLILEVVLLFVITVLNLKALVVRGLVEFILSLLKFVPLLIIAISLLYWFDSSNFTVDQSMSSLTTTQILGKVALLTFWGFIGLESATTPTDSVINPSKTIPRAIVFGTFCVSILYIANNIGIMGLIKGSELMYSKAPYVDATKIMFGGNWYLLVSFIGSIICIGTLNAWMFTSGQIALGLAEDGLLPHFLAKKNKNEVPFWGIIISAIGILPLLAVTADVNLSNRIALIIDFSVIAFLFVYLTCSIAFLKLLYNSTQETYYYQWLLGIISIIFCSWVMYETSIITLLTASMFTLSGVPIYFFWYCTKKKFHVKSVIS